jgi:tetratricopeptide (TPR) repeat protein
MRYTLLLLTAALFSACTQGPQVVAVNNTAPANQANRAERPQTAIAHTTEGQPAAPQSSAPHAGKWSQSGDPIDTARFDGVIAEAERAVKAKPNDEAAKKTLSQAYFDRADALTQARQYASALGDYRRSLKADPTNEDAKKWIDQIIGIYDMLKKDYPPEGQEPPPLPYDKSKNPPKTT